MSVVRRGFTLPELLISLVVLSVVVSLATHVAIQQLRFFRNVEALVERRSQLLQTTTIIRNAVWGASPGLGEIVIAQDSLIELRLVIGTSVACGGLAGEVVVPAPDSSGGNALTSFVRSPEPGDRLSVFFSDTLGMTWLQLAVAAAPVTGAACLQFPLATATWRIDVQEPLVLPAGAALRFTRPIRLTIYRSSDDRWYLGGQDWNGPLQRFNTIQPVAGPLDPYRATPESGLRFAYLDASGVELAQPVDVTRIAAVIVVARVEPDSSEAVIRLRNAS